MVLDYNVLKKQAQWEGDESYVLFFSFFLSLAGSLRALITRADALGTTSTVATLFWMISLTVTFIPFHSRVPFAISSPTFLGD